MNLTSILDPNVDPENNFWDRGLYDFQQFTNGIFSSLNLNPFTVTVMVLAVAVTVAVVVDIVLSRRGRTSYLVTFRRWVWYGLTDIWSFIKVLPVALKQRVAYRRRLKQAKADKRNQKAADVASSAVVVDEAKDEEIDLFAQLPTEIKLELTLNTALELMDHSFEIQDPEKRLADLQEAIEKIEECLDLESDFAPFFNQSTREEWNAIHDQGLEALRLLEQKHDAASTPS